MRLGQEELLYFGGLFWAFSFPLTLAHNVSREANKHTHLGLHWCAQFVAQCGWQEGKAMHFPVLPVKPALPQHTTMAVPVSHRATGAQTW